MRHKGLTVATLLLASTSLSGCFSFKNATKFVADHPNINSFALPQGLAELISSRPALGGTYPDRAAQMVGLVVVEDLASWEAGQLDWSKGLRDPFYARPDDQQSYTIALRGDQASTRFQAFFDQGFDAETNITPLGKLAGNISRGSSVEIREIVKVGFEPPNATPNEIIARVATLQPNQVLLWFTGFTAIRVTRQGHQEASANARLGYGAFAANGKLYEKTNQVARTTYLLPDAPQVYTTGGTTGLSRQTHWPTHYRGQVHGNR